MKSTKRLLALLLVLVMTMAFLAGCSNKDNADGSGGRRGGGSSNGDQNASTDVTAQDLVANMTVMDLEKYYNLGIKMDITGTQDGTEIGLTLDAKMEGAGTLSHMYDTSLSMNTEGFSLAFGMEGWIDAANNQTYANVSFLGEKSGWTVSPIEDESSITSIQDMALSFSNVGNNSSRVEAVLQPHNEGEDYIVTWTATAADLQNAMASAGDVAGEDDAFDFSAITSANVRAVFGATDRVLKTVTVTGSGDGQNITVEVAFYALNQDPSQLVGIPEDVIAEAVDGSGGLFGDPEGSSSWEFGFGSGGYINDNAGYDDLIDGRMVDRIRDKYPNSDLTVNHYGEVNSLWWAWDGDDWYCSLDFDHIAEANTWYDPWDDFRLEYEVNLETAGASALIMGSLEDGFAKFAYIDGFGDTHVRWAEIGEDYYVEVHASKGNGASFAEVQSIVNEALSISGLK